MEHHSDAGNPDRADPPLIRRGIRKLDKDLKRNPADLDQRETRGNYYLALADQEGDRAESSARSAEIDFSEVLAKRPRRAAVWSGRARARMIRAGFRRGNTGIDLLRCAEDDASEAIRIEPTAYRFAQRASIHVAHVEFLGDTAEAFQVLEKCRDDFAEAARLNPAESGYIYGAAGAMDMLAFGIEKVRIPTQAEAQAVLDTWLRGRDVAGCIEPKLQGRIARAYLMLSAIPGNGGEAEIHLLQLALAELESGVFTDSAAVNCLKLIFEMLNLIRPRDGHVHCYLTARAHMVQARFLEQRGDEAADEWSMACTLLAKTEKQDPHDTAVPLQRAWCFIRLHDWPAARAALDRVRAINPQADGLELISEALRVMEAGIQP